jgi:hypothetical protein
VQVARDTGAFGQALVEARVARAPRGFPIRGLVVTGESPAISYFGTEVISVVTTHGNDSSAGQKMHRFEC